MNFIWKSLYIFLFLAIVLFHFSCKQSTVNNQNNPVEENHPPIISNIILSRDTISIKDTCSIICIASDPDSDSLEYVWLKDRGYFNFISNEIAHWRSPYKYGKYIISCEVRDNRGGIDKDSIEINVLYWKPLTFPIGMIDKSIYFDFDNNGADDIIFGFKNYITFDFPISAISYFFDLHSLNNTSFLVDSLGNAPPFPPGFIISSITPGNNIWKTETINFGACDRRLSGSVYNTSYQGLWVGISNQYLPIRLSKNNEYYYGWIEMSMDTTKLVNNPLGQYVIHKYKIKDIPNEPIIAGGD